MSRAEYSGGAGAFASLPASGSDSDAMISALPKRRPSEPV